MRGDSARGGRLDPKRAWLWALVGRTRRPRIGTARALGFDATEKHTTMPGALRLRGGKWEMEVLPQRGGGIKSLRLAGVRLLDQGIGVDLPTAEGFVEGGAFGWDEMVPTVEPATWNGIALPDHC